MSHAVGSSSSSRHAGASSTRSRRERRGLPVVPGTTGRTSCGTPERHRLFSDSQLDPQQPSGKFLRVGWTQSSGILPCACTTRSRKVYFTIYRARRLDTTRHDSLGFPSHSTLTAVDGLSMESLGGDQAGVATCTCSRGSDGHVVSVVYTATTESFSFQTFGQSQLFINTTSGRRHLSRAPRSALSAGVSSPRSTSWTCAGGMSTTSEMPDHQFCARWQTSHLSRRARLIGQRLGAALVELRSTMHWLPVYQQAHRRPRSVKVRVHLLTGVGARQQAVGNTRVATQGQCPDGRTGADSRTAQVKQCTMCLPLPGFSGFLGLLCAEVSWPGLGLPGLALFFVSWTCALARVSLVLCLWGWCCCFSFSVGTDPRTSFLPQLSPSMFWDFGFLHPEPRVGGTLGRVRRDGSDGWRSPVPGASTWERVCLPLPPTIACRSRRQLADIVIPCGVDSCTRWQVTFILTGTTLRRHFLRAVAAAVTFVHVVAATSRLVVATQAS